MAFLSDSGKKKIYSDKKKAFGYVPWLQGFGKGNIGMGQLEAEHPIISLKTTFGFCTLSWVKSTGKN